MDIGGALDLVVFTLLSAALIGYLAYAMVHPETF